MVLVFLQLRRIEARAKTLVSRIGRFAPYAMIGVGLYTLSNTLTDAV